MSDDHTERFDRVPATGGDETSPSRASILRWWDDRFGIDPGVFEGLTFWERGRGNLWVVRGDHPTPVRSEGLGMVCLRTRGHDWKPTTNAAQRFGEAATKNVLALEWEAARRFVAGETQAVSWDGSRGYVLVATDVGGARAVLGVGQSLDGELRSVVPKGRQRNLIDRGP